MNWGEKRYYSLDWYLKNTFGEKVYKVALDGGMTCPNRDGTLGSRGCIFCSAGGSGDFAAKRQESVTKQIDSAIAGIQRTKKTGDKFIAYFQSYTNTYAPVSYLEPLFTEAISHPAIVALSIATRPDCMDDEILALLKKLSQIKPVWIELGLQSCHDKTAEFIRRGYPLTVFEKAVQELTAISIPVITHVILGLPHETREDVFSTIRYLNHLPIQGVKLQLLHVLKDTDLAGLLGTFPIPSMEEYVSLVIECLELLSPKTVVHRITGDGPRSLLLAPEWSKNKKTVMNHINQALRERDTWQGRLYTPPKEGDYYV
ncbi:TIGR01212 family radical SAM protein [Acetivibrio ethanolgignens]|uniref:Radical SAM protein n=1 Tax=Acetivibrio ethanolgignens TaxID=290052 RepID=A0A0V8QEM8_9FIRM|nr:TIGR01212 family radical SAM protein [Acetivibrio ethanolgignens]KSV58922.1 radical SAM protein [Acetivibrio ethanolgignens]